MIWFYYLAANVWPVPWRLCACIHQCFPNKKHTVLRSQTIVQFVDFDNCRLHEQLKVALICCSEGFHFNSKQCSYFF